MKKNIPIKCEAKDFVAIDKIKDLQGNLKEFTKDEYKKLIKSIIENGFIVPNFVWKNKKNELYSLDGKHRLIALKDLMSQGYKVGKDNKIPVAYIEAESKHDAIKKLLLINSHNAKIEEQGLYELLSVNDINPEFLNDLRLPDIDIEHFNDNFFNDEVEGLTDEDEVPDVDEENIIAKKGDLWILGNHRLLCGDSTKKEEVERLMNEEKADMVLTDPPYNVNYVGKTKDAMTIKNDSMCNFKFREFLKEAFISADIVMKKGAVFYIWHADSEGYNFRGACNDTGWVVRQCLVWNKNSMVMGRQDYHWKHETCLYGWKDGASHLWASDRKQTTVLNFERHNVCDLHPTMKPVELLRYQIENNTKGEDVVLDLFLGSGSTLIACEKTGRKCYGMELDQHYCDVILQRWADYTGEDPVREDGKKWSELH